MLRNCHETLQKLVVVPLLFRRGGTVPLLLFRRGGTVPLLLFRRGGTVPLLLFKRGQIWGQVWLCYRVTHVKTFV